MNSQEMYEKMKARLEKIVPDVELRIKAEIAVEIEDLKVKKNAVILGHNYMEPALFYSIPDFTGDSLDLSRKAAQTDKSVIVFCGVRFMAETAKILNPSKTVLLPAEKAGCSLAASITAQDVRNLKAKFPGIPVVSYVNTYADVKAESDICCTSSNAVAVVESLKSDTVIFLPDEYLAQNIAAQTKVKIIAWAGHCEVHERFTPAEVRALRGGHFGGPLCGGKARQAEEGPDRLGGFEAQKFAVGVEPLSGKAGDVETPRRHASRSSLETWTISIPAATAALKSSSPVPEPPCNVIKMPHAFLISAMLAISKCFCSVPAIIVFKSPCMFPTAGARTSTPVSFTNRIASSAVLSARFAGFSATISDDVPM